MQHATQPALASEREQSGLVGYARYFGLEETPFSLTPDPRYLYLSLQHQEALAHLLYGIGEGGGFVQLTGEVGTGKTTVSRALLEQLPEHVDAALIVNPRLSTVELLATLCEELLIPLPEQHSSVKPLVDALNAYLLDANARGRRTVLIVDEAQNLEHAVIEQIRLLTNLETGETKLLQVFLIGQPELRDLLSQPGLRQVAQRVTARHHLRPLRLPETDAYIRHRLVVAGCERRLFDAGAVRAIHRHSAGIPRLINMLCDRSLLGAYARDRLQVNARIVKRAAKELAGEPRVDARVRPAFAYAGLAAVVFAATAWSPNIWPLLRPDEPTPVVTAPAATMPAAEALPAPPPPPLSEAREGEPKPVEGAGSEDDEGLHRALLRGLLEDALKTDANRRYDGAARHLLAAWGADARHLSRTRVCESGAALGLRCIEDKGSWGDLRRINRPAMIELLFSGEAIPATITALDDDGVTLFVAGREVTIPLAAATEYWYGKYTILWRSPVGETRFITARSSRSAVRWLAETLDKLHGRAGDALQETQYNDNLVAEVRKFQASVGIAADGIVGAETMIQLNTARGDPGTPTLDRPARDSGQG